METVVVPDRLAEMPAGAELAIALHALPLAAVPNDRMLDVLRAQYRQLSHEQARTAATLVELARCDGVPGPGVVSRSHRPDEFAAHETRAALRWTRNAAEAEHGLSEAVLAVPELFAAWDAGRIDRPRVMVFERYLTGLTAQQVTVVCAAAVPRAPGLTTGQLDALLRRLVIEVDPDAAARWYRRGVRERTVHAYLAPDGTVTLSGSGLPPDEAEAACRRVEALAARAKRAGHPGRVGQIRSDVYLALLDGRFHGLTDDDIIARLLASPRRPEDTADLVLTGADDDRTDQVRATATEVDATEPEDDASADDPGTNDPGTDGATGAGGAGADASAHDPGADGAGADDAGPDNAGQDNAGADNAGKGAGADGVEPVGAGTRGGSRSGDGADAVCLDASRTAPDRRRGIEIRAVLSTLLGRDERPGEIPGLGPVLAAQARARVALQTAGHWRFAVLCAEGHLLSEGLLRRRPAGATRDGPPGGIVEIQIDQQLLTRLADEPETAGAWATVVAEAAAKHARYRWEVVDLDARPDDRFASGPLRRHTEIRDRTCTLAGVCRRPAHASAQDHRLDYAAGGATVRHNLGPVCALDHQLKHRAGWEASRPPGDPGTVVWTSPLGGQYPATGEFLTGPVLDPVPGPIPPPVVEPPEPVDDQPILRRPPPPDGRAGDGGSHTPSGPPDDPPPF